MRVTVDQPERRRRKASPDEILEAHPERTASACLHFETCGGCVWQHWTYEGQLQQKTNHVRQAISQGFDPNLVQDTIGMDEPWHYRNKMEFTFAPDGSMGLHEQGNFRKIISLNNLFNRRERNGRGGYGSSGLGKTLPIYRL